MLRVCQLRIFKECWLNTKYLCTLILTSAFIKEWFPHTITCSSSNIWICYCRLVCQGVFRVSCRTRFSLPLPRCSSSPVCTPSTGSAASYSSLWRSWTEPALQQQRRRRISLPCGWSISSTDTQSILWVSSYPQPIGYRACWASSVFWIVWQTSLFCSLPQLQGVQYRVQ